MTRSLRTTYGDRGTNASPGVLLSATEAEARGGVTGGTLGDCNCEDILGDVYRSTSILCINIYIYIYTYVYTHKVAMSMYIYTHTIRMLHSHIQGHKQVVLEHTLNFCPACSCLPGQMLLRP